MVRLQAAALLLAFSVIAVPGITLVVVLAATAAIGRNAAFTACAALAIPAPQVVVVQLHSTVCRSVVLDGIRHAGIVASDEVGNGVAPSCRRAMSWLDFRLPFTESMSPAMPDTIGAAKLVPTFLFVMSVKLDVVGVVVPALVVVSNENKHGPEVEVFTQLPPGALSAICGPKLLKLTLVPVCRMPAIAITPGQFAGVPTGPPSLPAEATTSTPFAVI
jgi:hypothetical protein